MQRTLAAPFASNANQLTLKCEDVVALKRVQSELGPDSSGSTRIDPDSSGSTRIESVRDVLADYSEHLVRT